MLDHHCTRDQLKLPPAEKSHFTVHTSAEQPAAQQEQEQAQPQNLGENLGRRQLITGWDQLGQVAAVWSESCVPRPPLPARLTAKTRCRPGAANTPGGGEHWCHHQLPALPLLFACICICICLYLSNFTGSCSLTPKEEQPPLVPLNEPKPLNSNCICLYLYCYEVVFVKSYNEL